MAPAAAATPDADRILVSPILGDKETADSMKKLTLDDGTNTQEGSGFVETPSEVQNGSGNGKTTNVSVPPREPSLTPLLQEMNQMMDPSSTWYYPSNCYYGGGYGTSGADWQEYNGYMNHEAVDMSSVPYGDYNQNGYGYVPYAAYPSPDSSQTLGNEGQMYGTQHYQYPAQYYQTSAPPSVPYTPAHTATSHGAPTSAAADQAPLAADAAKAIPNGTAKGNANGSNRLAPLKTCNQNPIRTSNNAYGRGGMHGALPTSGYQDLRYSSGAVHSPTPWFDSTALSAGQYTPASMTSAYPYNSRNSSARNPNQRSYPQLMGSHTQRPGMGSVTSGLLNKMYPNQMYAPLGNAYGSGYGFGANSYNSRINGFWNPATDNKYRSKGRGGGFYGYGNESPDGIGELNRGPRAGRFKNLKAVGPNATTDDKGQNISSSAKEDAAVVLPDAGQYNREDFPEKYSNAKFYIIKSYSEDDVHKSVKYGVWASTPNGNKKLDAAYKEAQEKSECPVFLLFSVNTSGQFVGLAEMVGPVDFEKSVEYWQQDKWFGCFTVKWHIVKDIPNSILKHITLEYNDNKPVTNSRDTQEVKLEQGLRVLKIFKEHVSKTSILDDFEFYENRQKLMQEKRASQQIQKQAPDGKTAEAVVDVNKESGEAVSVSDNKDGEAAIGAAVGDATNSLELKAKENGGDSLCVTELGTERPAALDGAADGC